MRRRFALKKLVATAIAVVYVQVNVAWCGVPTLPLSQDIRATAEHLPDAPNSDVLSAVKEALDKIFKRSVSSAASRAVYIFHRDPHDPLLNPPNPNPGGNNPQRNQNILPQDRAVLNRDIRNQRGQLNNAGRNVPAVERVNNDGNRNAARNRNAQQRMTPAQRAWQKKVDKQIEANIMKRGYVMVQGKRIYVHRDKETGQIVPIDPNATFTVKAKDATGRVVDMEVDIHHFVVRGGATLIAGAAHVGEGQLFNDGKVIKPNEDVKRGRDENQDDTAGIAMNNVHENIDLQTGQIQMQGGVGGGTMAVLIGVSNDQIGVTRFDNNSIVASPAIVENSKVFAVDGQGRKTLIAEAGKARVLPDGNNKFTDWKIAAGGDKIKTAKGDNVADFLGISKNHRPLVNKDNFRVGRVGLNDKGQVAGTYLYKTKAGLAAAKEIFANKPMPTTEIGMLGPQGRGTVVIRSDTRPDQLDAALNKAGDAAARLESINFDNKTERQIDAAVKGAIGNAPEIKRFDIAGTMKSGDVSGDIHVSGGRDNAGVMQAPNISTQDRALATRLFGADVVNAADKAAADRFARNGEKIPADAKTTYIRSGADNKVGAQVAFKVGDKTATVTAYVDRKNLAAKPTVILDRVASIHFHGAAAIKVREANGVNNAIGGLQAAMNKINESMPKASAKEREELTKDVTALGEASDALSRGDATVELTQLVENGDGTVAGTFDIGFTDMFNVRQTITVSASADAGKDGVHMDGDSARKLMGNATANRMERNGTLNTINGLKESISKLQEQIDNPDDKSDKGKLKSELSSMRSGLAALENAGKGTMTSLNFSKEGAVSVGLAFQVNGQTVGATANALVNRAGFQMDVRSALQVFSASVVATMRQQGIAGTRASIKESIAKTEAQIKDPKDTTDKKELASDLALLQAAEKQMDVPDSQLELTSLSFGADGNVMGNFNVTLADGQKGTIMSGVSSGRVGIQFDKAMAEALVGKDGAGRFMAIAAVNIQKGLEKSLTEATKKLSETKDPKEREKLTNNIAALETGIKKLQTVTGTTLQSVSINGDGSVTGSLEATFASGEKGTISGSVVSGRPGYQMDSAMADTVFGQPGAASLQTSAWNNTLAGLGKSIDVLKKEARNETDVTKKSALEARVAFAEKSLKRLEAANAAGNVNMTSLFGGADGSMTGALEVKIKTERGEERTINIMASAVAGRAGFQMDMKSAEGLFDREGVQALRSTAIFNTAAFLDKNISEAKTKERKEQDANTKKDITEGRKALEKAKSDLMSDSTGKRVTGISVGADGTVSAIVQFRFSTAKGVEKNITLSVSALSSKGGIQMDRKNADELFGEGVVETMEKTAIANISLDIKAAQKKNEEALKAAPEGSKKRDDLLKEKTALAEGLKDFNDAKGKSAVGFSLSDSGQLSAVVEMRLPNGVMGIVSSSAIGAAAPIQMDRRTALAMFKEEGVKLFTRRALENAAASLKTEKADLEKQLAGPMKEEDRKSATADLADINKALTRLSARDTDVSLQAVSISGDGTINSTLEVTFSVGGTTKTFQMTASSSQGREGFQMERAAAKILFDDDGLARLEANARPNMMKALDRAIAEVDALLADPADDDDVAGLQKDRAAYVAARDRLKTAGGADQISSLAMASDGSITGVLDITIVTSTGETKQVTVMGSLLATRAGLQMDRATAENLFGSERVDAIQARGMANAIATIESDIKELDKKIAKAPVGSDERKKLEKDRSIQAGGLERLKEGSATVNLVGLAFGNDGSPMATLEMTVTTGFAWNQKKETVTLSGAAGEGRRGFQLDIPGGTAVYGEEGMKTISDNGKKNIVVGMEAALKDLDKRIGKANFLGKAYLMAQKQELVAVFAELNRAPVQRMTSLMVSAEGGISAGFEFVLQDGRSVNLVASGAMDRPGLQMDRKSVEILFPTMVSFFQKAGLDNIVANAQARVDDIKRKLEDPATSTADRDSLKENQPKAVAALAKLRESGVKGNFNGLSIGSDGSVAAAMEVILKDGEKLTAQVGVISAKPAVQFDIKSAIALYGLTDVNKTGRANILASLRDLLTEIPTRLEQAKTDIDKKKINQEKTDLEAGIKKLEDKNTRFTATSFSMSSDGAVSMGVDVRLANGEKLSVMTSPFAGKGTLQMDVRSAVTLFGEEAVGRFTASGLLNAEASFGKAIAKIDKAMEKASPDEQKNLTDKRERLVKAEKEFKEGGDKTLAMLAFGDGAVTGIYEMKLGGEKIQFSASALEGRAGIQMDKAAATKIFGDETMTEFLKSGIASILAGAEGTLKPFKDKTPAAGSDEEKDKAAAEGMVAKIKSARGDIGMVAIGSDGSVSTQIELSYMDGGKMVTVNFLANPISPTGAQADRRTFETLVGPESAARFEKQGVANLLKSLDKSLEELDKKIGKTKEGSDERKELVADRKELTDGIDQIRNGKEKTRLVGFSLTADGAPTGIMDVTLKSGRRVNVMASLFAGKAGVQMDRKAAEAVFTADGYKRMAKTGREGTLATLKKDLAIVEEKLKSPGKDAKKLTAQKEALTRGIKTLSDPKTEVSMTAMAISAEGAVSGVFEATFAGRGMLGVPTGDKTVTFMANVFSDKPSFQLSGTDAAELFSGSGLAALREQGTENAMLSITQQIKQLTTEIDNSEGEPKAKLEKRREGLEASRKMMQDGKTIHGVTALAFNEAGVTGVLEMTHTQADGRQVKATYMASVLLGNAGMQLDKKSAEIVLGLPQMTEIVAQAKAAEIKALEAKISGIADPKERKEASDRLGELKAAILAADVTGVGVTPGGLIVTMDVTVGPKGAEPGKKISVTSILPAQAGSSPMLAMEKADFKAVFGDNIVTLLTTAAKSPEAIEPLRKTIKAGDLSEFIALTDDGDMPADLLNQSSGDATINTFAAALEDAESANFTFADSGITVGLSLKINGQAVSVNSTLGATGPPALQLDETNGVRAFGASIWDQLSRHGAGVSLEPMKEGAKKFEKDSPEAKLAAKAETDVADLLAKKSKANGITLTATGVVVSYLRRESDGAELSVAVVLDGERATLASAVGTNFTFAHAQNYLAAYKDGKQAHTDTTIFEVKTGDKKSVRVTSVDVLVDESFKVFNQTEIAFRNGAATTRTITTDTEQGGLDDARERTTTRIAPIVDGETVVGHTKSFNVIRTDREGKTVLDARSIETHGRNGLESSSHYLTDERGKDRGVSEHVMKNVIATAPKADFSRSLDGVRYHFNNGVVTFDKDDVAARVGDGQFHKMLGSNGEITDVKVEKDGANLKLMMRTTPTIFSDTRTGVTLDLVGMTLSEVPGTTDRRDRGTQLTVSGTLMRGRDNEGNTWQVRQTNDGVTFDGVTRAGTSEVAAITQAETFKFGRSTVLVQPNDARHQGKRQNIQTILDEADIGQTTVTFSDSRVKIGVVSRPPEGTVMLVGEDLKNKVSGIVMDPATHLGIRTKETDAMGRTVEQFIFTSDQAVQGPNGDRFRVAAGAVFDLVGSGSEQTVGALRQGMLLVSMGESLTLGQEENIHVIKGGSGGSAMPDGKLPPSSEQVTYEYRKEGMVMLVGVAYVENGQIGFKEGTIFNNHRVKTYAGEVGEVSDGYGQKYKVLQADGSFKQAVKLLTPWGQDQDAAIKADIPKIFEKAAGKAEDGSVQFLVINTSNQLVGTYSKNVRRTDDPNRDDSKYIVYRTQYHQNSGFSRGGGSYTSQVDSGLRHAQGGDFALNDRFKKDIDGRFTGNTVYHWNEDSGEVRKDSQTHSERLVSGIKLKLPGQDERLAQGKLRLVENLNPKKEEQRYSLVFSEGFVGQDGKWVSEGMGDIDVTSVFADAMATGKGEPGQAKANRDTTIERAKEFIRTGRVEGIEAGREIQFLVVSKVRTATTVYNLRKYERGISEFGAAVAHTFEFLWDNRNNRGARMGDIESTVATREMDAHFGHLQGLLEQVFRGGTSLSGPNGALSNVTSERAWYRKLDVVLGEMFTNRIMDLDASQGLTANFAVKFTVATIEQFLNFFTMGGGAAIRALQSIRATTTVIQGGSVAVRTAQAGRVAIMINRVHQSVETMRATFSLGRLIGVGGAAAVRYTLGSGMIIFFRAQAFEAAQKAVDVSATKGFFSSESGNAWGDAAWKMVVAEFQWLLPMVGKTLSFIPGVRNIFGLGATAAEGAKVGFWGSFAGRSIAAATVGAIIGAGADVISGNGFGWSNLYGAAKGALVGIGLVGISRLNIIGQAKKAAEGGKAAEKALSPADLLKAIEGAIPLSRGERLLIAIRATPGFLGREVGLPIVRMLLQAGLGGVVAVGVNGLGNIQAAKTGKDRGGFWAGSRHAFKVGAVFGIFMGGGLRAMSNWGNVAGVQKTKTFGEHLSENFGRVRQDGMERVMAGASMGAWEVVFNSSEFEGGWDYLNPLTYADGIGQLIGEGTDALHITHREERLEARAEARSQSSLEKFKGTFVNIAMLHRFFAAGIVATNYASAGVQLVARNTFGRGATEARRVLALAAERPGMVSEAALSSARATMARVNSVDKLVNFTMVNPINIETFKFFEEVGMHFGAWLLGLEAKKEMNPRTGQMQLLVRDLGSDEPFREATNFEFYVIEATRVLFFINAPTHSDTRTVAEKEASATLAGIQQGPVGNAVSSSGGFWRGVFEGARQERVAAAKQLAQHLETFVSTLRQRTEDNNGRAPDFPFQTRNGQFTLTADQVTTLLNTSRPNFLAAKAADVGRGEYLTHSSGKEPADAAVPTSRVFIADKANGEQRQFVEPSVPWGFVKAVLKPATERAQDAANPTTAERTAETTPATTDAALARPDATGPPAADGLATAGPRSAADTAPRTETADYSSSPGLDGRIAPAVSVAAAQASGNTRSSEKAQTGQSPINRGNIDIQRVEDGVVQISHKMEEGSEGHVQLNAEPSVLRYNGRVFAGRYDQLPTTLKLDKADLKTDVEISVEAMSVDHATGILLDHQGGKTQTPEALGAARSRLEMSKDETLAVLSRESADFMVESFLAKGAAHEQVASLLQNDQILSDPEKVLSELRGNLTEAGQKKFDGLRADNAANKALVDVAMRVDAKGMEALRQIIEVAKPEVLKAFLTELSQTRNGARHFAQILNGLDKAGLENIVKMFETMDKKGAGLFARIVDAARPEALVALLGALSIVGAGAFASLMNEIADSPAADRLVNLMSSLDAIGGKNIAGIFNDAAATEQFKVFLQNVDETGAKNFGFVMNGLTVEAAKIIVDALGKMNESMVKNLARFMENVGTKGKGVLAVRAFLNELGEKRERPDKTAGPEGVDVFTNLFKNMSEAQAAKLGQFFQQLSVRAGQQLARLMSAKDGEAGKLAQAITSMSDAGLVALALALAVGTPWVGHNFGILLADDQTREETKRLLETADSEGGAVVGHLVGKLAGEGFAELARLLKKDHANDPDAAKILGEATHQMSTVGAELLGATLGELKNDTARDNLKALLLDFAKDPGAFGRLFTVMAKRGFTPDKLAEALGKRQASDTAYYEAGYLLMEAFKKGAYEDPGRNRNSLMEAIKEVAGDSDVGIKDVVRGVLGVDWRGPADGRRDFNQALFDNLAGTNLTASQRAALAGLARRMGLNTQELDGQRVRMERTEEIADTTPETPETRKNRADEVEVLQRRPALLGEYAQYLAVRRLHGELAAETFAAAKEAGYTRRELDHIATGGVTTVPGTKGATVELRGETFDVEKTDTGVKLTDKDGKVLIDTSGNRNGSGARPVETGAYQAAMTVLNGANEATLNLVRDSPLGARLQKKKGANGPEFTILPPVPADAVETLTREKGVHEITVEFVRAAADRLDSINLTSRSLVQALSTVARGEAKTPAETKQKAEASQALIDILTNGQTTITLNGRTWAITTAMRSEALLTAADGRVPGIKASELLNMTASTESGQTRTETFDVPARGLGGLVHRGTVQRAREIAHRTHLIDQMAMEGPGSRRSQDIVTEFETLDKRFKQQAIDRPKDPVTPTLEEAAVIGLGREIRDGGTIQRLPPTEAQARAAARDARDACHVLGRLFGAPPGLRDAVDMVGFALGLPSLGGRLWWRARALQKTRSRELMAMGVRATKKYTPEEQAAIIQEASELGQVMEIIKDGAQVKAVIKKGADLKDIRGGEARVPEIIRLCNQLFVEFERDTGITLTRTQAEDFVNKLLFNLNVMVEAPLGAGKTDVLLRIVPKILMAMHPNHIHRVVVVFSDSKALNEYLKNSGEQGDDASVKALRSEYMDGDMSGLVKRLGEQGTIIATTREALKSLVMTLTNPVPGGNRSMVEELARVCFENTHAMFDEAHELPASPDLIRGSGTEAIVNHRLYETVYKPHAEKADEFYTKLHQTYGKNLDFETFAKDLKSGKIKNRMEEPLIEFDRHENAYRLSQAGINLYANHLEVSVSTLMGPECRYQRAAIVAFTEAITGVEGTDFGRVTRVDGEMGDRINPLRVVPISENRPNANMRFGDPFQAIGRQLIGERRYAARDKRDSWKNGQYIRSLSFEESIALVETSPESVRITDAMVVGQFRTVHFVSGTSQAVVAPFNLGLSVVKLGGATWGAEDGTLQRFTDGRNNLRNDQIFATEHIEGFAQALQTRVKDLAGQSLVFCGEALGINDYQTRDAVLNATGGYYRLMQRGDRIEVYGEGTRATTTDDGRSTAIGTMQAGDLQKILQPGGGKLKYFNFELGREITVEVGEQRAKQEVVIFLDKGGITGSDLKTYSFKPRSEAQEMASKDGNLATGVGENNVSVIYRTNVQFIHIFDPSTTSTRAAQSLGRQRPNNPVFEGEKGADSVGNFNEGHKEVWFVGDINVKGSFNNLKAHLDRNEVRFRHTLIENSLTKGLEEAMVNRFVVAIAMARNGAEVQALVRARTAFQSESNINDRLGPSAFETVHDRVKAKVESLQQAFSNAVGGERNNLSRDNRILFTGFIREEVAFDPRGLGIFVRQRLGAHEIVTLRSDLVGQRIFDQSLSSMDFGDAVRSLNSRLSGSDLQFEAGTPGGSRKPDAAVMVSRQDVMVEGTRRGINTRKMTRLHETLENRDLYDDLGGMTLAGSRMAADLMTLSMMDAEDWVDMNNALPGLGIPPVPPTNTTVAAGTPDDDDAYRLFDNLTAIGTLNPAAKGATVDNLLVIGAAVTAGLIKKGTPITPADLATGPVAFERLVLAHKPDGADDNPDLKPTLDLFKKRVDLQDKLDEKVDRQRDMMIDNPTMAAHMQANPGSKAAVFGGAFRQSPYTGGLLIIAQLTVAAIGQGWTQRQFDKTGKKLELQTLFPAAAAGGAGGPPTDTRLKAAMVIAAVVRPDTTRHDAKRMRDHLSHFLNKPGRALGKATVTHLADAARADAGPTGAEARAAFTLAAEPKATTQSRTARVAKALTVSGAVVALVALTFGVGWGILVVILPILIKGIFGIDLVGKATKGILKKGDGTQREGISKWTLLILIGVACFFGFVTMDLLVDASRTAFEEWGARNLTGGLWGLISKELAKTIGLKLLGAIVNGTATFVVNMTVNPLWASGTRGIRTAAGWFGLNILSQGTPRAVGARFVTQMRSRLEARIQAALTRKAVRNELGEVEKDAPMQDELRTLEGRERDQVSALQAASDKGDKGTVDLLTPALEQTREAIEAKKREIIDAEVPKPTLTNLVNDLESDFDFKDFPPAERAEAFEEVMTELGIKDETAQVFSKRYVMHAVAREVADMKGTPAEREEAFKKRLKEEGITDDADIADAEALYAALVQAGTDPGAMTAMGERTIEELIKTEASPTVLMTIADMETTLSQKGYDVTPEAIDDYFANASTARPAGSVRATKQQVQAEYAKGTSWNAITLRWNAYRTARQGFQPGWAPATGGTTANAADTTFKQTNFVTERAKTRSNAEENLLALAATLPVGSSRVDLQACKLEYSIVSPK